MQTSKQIFEIHITGEKAILAELDILGIKNITVELLTPNQELFRTEYMSSYLHNADNFN